MFDVVWAKFVCNLANKKTRRIKNSVVYEFANY